MDHLIAEMIAYVKSQVVENLAEEKSDENSCSINSQNDVNYINHVIGELIDSVKDEKDTCLTQDSQDVIDGVDVPIKPIQGKVDNYSMEYPITYACGEVDFQSIDKCEMVKLQDGAIEVHKEHVPNEQEIEECIQEEVVSDMTLPEVYRVDTEIHTDVVRNMHDKIRRKMCNSK